MDKLYVGHRYGLGTANVQVIEGEDRRVLDPRYDLRNHSPDGFEWGYGGSGPAQLALAILADASANDEVALKHYQTVKARLIAPLQEDDWTLTEHDILDSIMREAPYE